jgi:hypothetical protein
LSTKVTPAGRVGDSVVIEIVILGVGVPVVVTVKELETPIGKAVLEALVMAGAGLVPETVSVAGKVVAEPAVFVKTARYWLPFMEAATAVSMSVVEVAPLMLVNTAPPLVLNCHCTVGVGLPVAAAVNVTLDPSGTVWLTGFVVTTGVELAEFTVNVAAVLVAEPTELVNTARYMYPFCDVITPVRVSVVEVAPGMLA